MLLFLLRENQNSSLGIKDFQWFSECLLKGQITHKMKFMSSFYLPSYFLKSITGNFQKHFLYNLFLCVYIG